MVRFCGRRERTRTAVVDLEDRCPNPVGRRAFEKLESRQELES